MTRGATYTGRPCKNCGTCIKYVAGKTCIVCARRRSRALSGPPGWRRTGAWYARDEARRKGLMTYWAPNKCKRGHASPRYTSNKKCVKCSAVQQQEAQPRLLLVGRAWRKKNASRLRAEKRERHLQKSYGMTSAQYDARERLQEGRCEICQRTPTKRRLAVDHCHSTGRVRGLICDDCNVGLGRFADSPERIEEALWYLRRYI